MLPARLRAENYGPYRVLDITFDVGVAVVLGEIRGGPPGVDSNGSGKSHVVNGPAVALYGPAPGVKIGDLLSNSGDVDSMTVELTFRQADATYRVRRSYSAKGAGKQWLDLEQLDGDTWATLTSASIKYTQAMIDRLVGMNQATFLASACMLQNAPSFASQAVSRVERFDLLAGALNLGEYDAYQAEARAERREAEAQAARLADRIGQGEAELARLPDAELALATQAGGVEALAKALGEAEAEHEKLSARWQQTQQASADRRAAEAELAAATLARQQLGDQEAAAQDAEQTLLDARKELDGLATADEVAAAETAYAAAKAAYERARANQQEAEEIARKTAALTKQAVTLETATYSGETCPTCKRPLDDPQARHRVIESYWADVSALDQRAAELATTGDGAAEEPSDADVQRVRADVGKYMRLEERSSAASRTIAAVRNEAFWTKIRAADNSLVVTRKRLAEIPPVEEELPDLVEDLRRVESARAALISAKERKAVAAHDVTRLRQLDIQTASDRAHHRRELQAAELAGQMEWMYGRDGIPVLVLENVAIPYLEAETADVLSRLGVAWQVELRTERALKTREGTAAALDVVLIRENGVEQPYQLFSGGEKFRIAVAIQVAFARLLRRRTGAHADMFALDEPPYLDAAGMSALGDVLDELAREFAVVLVVSHDSAIRDAFEHTIRVVRENGRSRVDCREAEAVPA